MTHLKEKEENPEKNIIQIIESMHENDERFRLIIENANDLIRVVKIDKFQIEYINETAHFKTLGYTKEEYIKYFRSKVLHPEEIDEGVKFLKKILNNGEAIREGRFRHKEGHWLWFEIKGKKFISAHGNEKILFISRDICERKKYDTMLKDFIVVASHQLRTPVSALVQSMNNLKKYNSKMNEETKLELLDVISRNITRLSELVENLTKLSEIDDKTLLSPKLKKLLGKKEKLV